MSFAWNAEWKWSYETNKTKEEFRLRVMSLDDSEVEIETWRLA
jgi:hypothetical protein